MTDANDLHTQFSAAIDYLYGFINFEKRRQDRYMASKLDSTRPARLMAVLGDPHTGYPSIHIAGTKGKGSVAAMCAFALRAAGYRVGLYTSPHLQDFRERIRVLTADDPDGLIPEAAFIRNMDRIKQVADHFPDITWFEILTAVAFSYFAKAEVDVAVVEVGLGGRLDATNVLTPLVSVITSLSLDHTKFLGNTLSEIAFEKGGIIKPGVPVVIAPQKAEATRKLRELALERGAPLTEVGVDWAYRHIENSPHNGYQQLQILRSGAPDWLPPGTQFKQALLGEHQLENGAVALAALAVAQPYLPRLTLAAVSAGLQEVEWDGRLQLVHPGTPATPQLLVDCAHNPHSAAQLKAALPQFFDYRRLWLIFGAPQDKDIAGMLELLVPLAAGVVTTTASHPRSAAPRELAELATAVNTPVTPPVFSSINMNSALRKAWDLAAPGDLICCTGSIIVVGDLLNQWESLQSELLQQKSPIPTRYR
jgi:dihydrofolate synthase/folylpolyglutamate synthase